MRGADGTPMLAPASTGKYSVEKWLLADGDARDASAVGTGSFRCDPLGCIGTIKGKTVALVGHPAALADDCRRADIVIVPFTVGERCRANIVIDRRRRKSGGAHALYIEGYSVRTETVAAARGNAPVGAGEACLAKTSGGSWKRLRQRRGNGRSGAPAPLSGQ